MAIIWKDNLQIKTPHGTPKCTHGPALAVLGDNLYMVYVGEGGKNLWSCYLPGGQNFNGWNNWQDNKQIKVSHDNIPLSSFRPALLAYSGRLFMVYRGAGATHVWWSWFDGTAWKGNTRVRYAGDEGPGSVITRDGMPEPALGLYGGTLILVLREHVQGKDSRGRPVEADDLFSLNGTVAPASSPEGIFWFPPNPLPVQGIMPALTEFPIARGTVSPVYAFSTDTGTGEFHWSKFTGGWTSSGILQVNGNQVKSSGGAALAVLDNVLYVVYPDLNGSSLAYTTVDPGLVSSGASPVQTATSQLETSAPVGAATFNNSVCIAYKDRKNDTVWFTHYP